MKLNGVKISILILKYLKLCILCLYGPENFLNYRCHSVLFSSVTQSCPTLCDPMNHSTPSLPVHHQHPEFAQIHIHQMSLGTIQSLGEQSRQRNGNQNRIMVQLFWNNSDIQLLMKKRKLIIMNIAGITLYLLKEPGS